MTAAVLARPTLNVALVDDHPAVRGGLLALLSSVDGISVVGEPAEADVLIVDGLPALHQARRTAPTAAVIMFTASVDVDAVCAAMRAGARAYLLKSAERDDIVRAVRAVAAGEVIFAPQVASRLTELMTRQAMPFPDLTAREREILHLIARGLDNAGIARQLLLAPKTVRNNICMIFSKLNVTDRAQAVARAREAGFGR
jgi:DNA-binding NarL/FixJ family response regulator